MRSADVNRYTSSYWLTRWCQRADSTSGFPFLLCKFASIGPRWFFTTFPEPAISYYLLSDSPSLSVDISKGKGPPPSAESRAYCQNWVYTSGVNDWISWDIVSSMILVFPVCRIWMYIAMRFDVESLWEATSLRGRVRSPEDDEGVAMSEWCNVGGSATNSDILVSDNPRIFVKLLTHSIPWPYAIGVQSQPQSCFRLSIRCFTLLDCFS